MNEKNKNTFLDDTMITNIINSNLNIFSKTISDSTKDQKKNISGISQSMGIIGDSVVSLVSITNSSNSYMGDINKAIRKQGDILSDVVSNMSDTISGLNKSISDVVDDVKGVMSEKSDDNEGLNREQILESYKETISIRDNLDEIISILNIRDMTKRKEESEVQEPTASLGTFLGSMGKLAKSLPGGGLTKIGLLLGAGGLILSTLMGGPEAFYDNLLKPIAKILKSILEPVFDWLMPVLGGMFGNILPPFIAGMKSVFGSVGDIIQQATLIYLEQQAPAAFAANREINALIQSTVDMFISGKSIKSQIYEEFNTLQDDMKDLGIKLKGNGPEIYDPSENELFKFITIPDDKAAVYQKKVSELRDKMLKTRNSLPANTAEWKHYNDVYEKLEDMLKLKGSVHTPKGVSSGTTLQYHYEARKKGDANSPDVMWDKYIASGGIVSQADQYKKKQAANRDAALKALATDPNFNPKSSLTRIKMISNNITEDDVIAYRKKQQSKSPTIQNSVGYGNPVAGTLDTSEDQAKVMSPSIYYYAPIPSAVLPSTPSGTSTSVLDDASFSLLIDTLGPAKTDGSSAPSDAFYSIHSD